MKEFMQRSVIESEGGIYLASCPRSPRISSGAIRVEPLRGSWRNSIVTMLTTTPAGLNMNSPGLDAPKLDSPG
ncbi:hypothetical protein QE390_004403 [Siphonobacter sp. SORGH_AS 1065]|nr:hypothetical protein [Siphonobacter sp. SORGH_AS_1065]